MLALVKNKRHTWSFINSYRVPHRKVNVFQCARCKCQKFVTIDNLTHSHINTNYVQGKETITKVPDCFTRENLLFD